MTATTTARFAERVARVQDAMAQAGLDVLYVGHSTDLEYLTGTERMKPSYGPARYFAHWAMGAVIGREGAPAVLVPRMLAEFAVEVRFGELRVIHEADDPVAAMRAAIAAVTPEPARIGVNVDAHAELVLELARAFPGASVELAAPLLARLRAIKAPDEIALLRDISRFTEEVLEDALEQVGACATTAELSRWIADRIVDRGWDGPSFTPGVSFVATGAGPTPALGPRGSLLLDFGVVTSGYCTDFARTVHVGEPTVAYREAYALILRAQDAGAAALRPGTPARDVDAAARDVVERAGLGEYFRHRAGHGVGKDVNEPPYLEAVDGQPIEAGMVFTVEPGVMTPEHTAFIEDLYLVGQSGGERLNTLSRDLRVI